MDMTPDPRPSGPVESYLGCLHRDIATLSDGEVADYIPELAKSDPEDFAIAIASVDGALYTAGCADKAFTIQSVSKPFMFAYAIESCGIDAVMQKVGVEPTGDSFNSIVLDEVNNRPFNPMVNAGAIAMSEQIRGDTLEAREAEQIGFFSRIAGRDLGMDHTVYLSERETGHRNRAIAHMMLNNGMIRSKPDDVLDIYFRQCSTLVTAEDLAIMGATLAAHGRNPQTGKRVLSPTTVRDVLSVMATCGMYNYAGQWMFDVGLPAKSGVSGGILAVLPGQFGIAVYSPRLDDVGNSVQGIEVCKRLSRDFGLHAYVDRTDTRNVVRRSYSGARVRSNRVRTSRDLDTLAEAGGSIAVVEAQGPLYFGSAERLIREVTALPADPTEIIIDLRRVTYADTAAVTLLRHAVQNMATGRGARLNFTEAQNNANLEGFRAAFSQEEASGQCRFHASIDEALEEAEDDILEFAGRSRADERLSLGELELFQGMPEDDLAVLETAISTFSFARGETILTTGDEAKLTFVVARGSVSILIRDEAGQKRRTASIGPGQSFGEMALLDGGRRSADVRADTEVLAYGISVAELKRLAKDRPLMLPTILGNIIRSVSTRLRNANDQIRAMQ
ncbi:glutaminase A [Halovulum sp. GXIMD14794]